jgi:hypothetical protein
MQSNARGILHPSRAPFVRHWPATMPPVARRCSLRATAARTLRGQIEIPRIFWRLRLRIDRSARRRRRRRSRAERRRPQRSFAQVAVFRVFEMIDRDRSCGAATAGVSTGRANRTRSPGNTAEGWSCTDAASRNRPICQRTPVTTACACTSLAVPAGAPPASVPPSLGCRFFTT